MTAKRDLKKRIRDRAARTGESYTAARRHIVGKPSQGAVPFIELRDLSEDAARIGLLCPVHIFPELAQRIDCAAALERIRDALRATDGDPKTELLRSVALRGEQPEAHYDLASDPLRDPRIALMLPHRGVPPVVADAFMTRVRAGIGGVSDSGRMLALAVAGRRGMEMVVCSLVLSPWLQRPSPAALLLLGQDDLLIPAL
jgi:hypothetical protein